MTDEVTRQERAPKGRSLLPRIRRAVEWIASASSVIAALTILAAAFIVTSDGISRTVTGHSIRGVYEIVAVMVVVIGFLGIAHAEVTGNHVRVTLFTGLMPARVASLVQFIAMMLTSAFFAWMCVELVKRAADSFSRTEMAQPGLLELPLWPSRALVAFGIASLLMICACKAFDHLMDVIRPRATPAVADTDVELSEGGLA